MEGFVYPNEVVVQWSLLIALYPYLTGLVAGAFIVSSLYHLFGVTSLRPIAPLSLITALAFVLVAPLPLLVHLGRPERGLEIYWTPHLSSAMAGFGYIWLFYTVLLVFETWLVFRKDIVRHQAASRGLKKVLYSALALGVYDVPERSLKTDGKIVKILSAIGIPGAAFLHGYVGFIFGSVKANPWWSTPLMPAIFLLSAIVSGIALLIVLYVIVSQVRRQPLDHNCLGSLAGWLLGFLLIDVTLEVMEVVSMMYELEESWEIVSQLITQKIALSYLGIQMALGAVVPLILLGAMGLARWSRGIRSALAFSSSVLLLVGVFAMRWNVVIGGQLISKTLRGFVTYSPPLGGKESALSALAIMGLSLLLLGAIAYFLPPWRKHEEEKPTLGSR